MKRSATKRVAGRTSVATKGLRDGSLRSGSSASEPSEARIQQAVGNVELFFKTPQDLEKRVDFLRSHGVNSFNLVNKDKRDDMESWVNCIERVYPEAKVCAHYSLKHNKVPRKGVEDHAKLLLDVLEKNDERSFPHEILLVSGSGKKTAWNTVEALRAIRDWKRDKTLTETSHPLFAVAYNPYFLSQSDQEEENRRMLEKLALGCVSTVYLQFGTDLKKVRQGVDFLRKDGGFSGRIVGSLFLPTKQLIAQQKFRPWNGVFLSNEFLEGPRQARRVVVEMMQEYMTSGVDFLWEAPGIKTEKDMDLVFDLLKDASATTSSVQETNVGNNSKKQSGDPSARKRPRESPRTVG